MDPLFNLYHRDTNLYLEEANAPTVKVGDRTYKLKDYDPNIHFMALGITGMKAWDGDDGMGQRWKKGEIKKEEEKNESI